VPRLSPSLVALSLLATPGCLPDAWTFPEPVVVNANDASDANDANDANDADTDAPCGEGGCPDACGARCVGPCGPGPVALYRGDGNARDSAGENHGVASLGVSYVEGRYGRAFNISGSPRYVALPPSVGDFKGDFTIGLWFKTTHAGVIISRRAACWAVPPYVGQDIGLTNEGNISMEVLTLSNHFELQSERGMNDGEWHHTALVRRADTVELVVGGVMVDSHPIRGDFIDPTSSPTYFGVSRCVVGAPGSNGTADGRLWYVGAFDEVAYYDRALSPDELLAWAQGRCAP
jgi:hypothetical protein